jgi:hypothetical protein
MLPSIKNVQKHAMETRQNLVFFFMLQTSFPYWGYKRLRFQDKPGVKTQLSVEMCTAKSVPEKK